MLGIRNHATKQNVPYYVTYNIFFSVPIHYLLGKITFFKGEKYFFEETIKLSIHYKIPHLKCCPFIGTRKVLAKRSVVARRLLDNRSVSECKPKPVVVDVTTPSQPLNSDNSALVVGIGHYVIVTFMWKLNRIIKKKKYLSSTDFKTNLKFAYGINFILKVGVL